MVNGEAIVSQANTEEYRSNHERIFGERKVQRGRFVYDPKLGRCVPADQYVPEALAKDAPIIADRIHEGTVSPIDGSDIGSRQKRREHMKVHGVEDATDCSPEWRAGVKKQRERDDDRSRRSAMDQAARKLYREGKWR